MEAVSKSSALMRGRLGPWRKAVSVAIVNDRYIYN
jgi:hypothetical protein